MKTKKKSNNHLNNEYIFSSPFKDTLPENGIFVAHLAYVNTTYKIM